MKEYVIWGISPKHGENEQVLISNAKNQANAERLMQYLKQHGCHSMRVQVLDLNECPSKLFKKGLTK